MTVPERRVIDAEDPTTTATAANLTELHRAILLTVLYSDLFDYPVTEPELYRNMVRACPERSEFERALGDLMGHRLTSTGPLITLAGREHLVAVRQQRQPAVERGWVQAERYARWLAWVPFLRMVAVCGSQAAGNATVDADVDFFLVTERGRLWTVQVCSMLLRRLVSLASVRVCPNYLLAADALEVRPRTLYSAREAAQAELLWGEDTYAQFLESNRWIAEFLPHAHQTSDRGQRMESVVRPTVTRFVEWLLGGWLGNALDRTLYRLLMLYYPLRLRHLGWRTEQFRRAYRRDQQVVMQGGYGPAVARAFRQRVVSYFGEPAASKELARLFPVPSGHGEASEPDRLYARLFAERYGQAHE